MICYSLKAFYLESPSDIREVMPMPILGMGAKAPLAPPPVEPGRFVNVQC